MQDAAPAGLEPPPTSSWTDYSTTSCKLHFFNFSGRSVQIVWLSYDGTDTVYNVLAPGQEAHQETYTTHVWEVRTEEGHRLMQYTGHSAKLYILPAGVSVVGVPPPPAAAESGPSTSAAEARDA